jgi:hypothetical protein
MANKKRAAKPKAKTVIYYNKLVTKIATQCREIVIAETEKLEGIERWLILSRVYAVLFTSHYRLSVGAADKTVKKVLGERTDGEGEN